MKFRTGYVYHFVTAIVFAFAALYIWLNPDVLGGLSGNFRILLMIILLLWAAFRGSTAWFMYKKSKRNDPRE